MSDNDLTGTDSRELWWHCESHPHDLLEFLEDRIAGRKWRLFMCACGRRCQEQLPGAVFRNAIDISEAYADGESSRDTMLATATAAYRELQKYSQQPEMYRAGEVSVEVVSLGGDYLFDVTIRLIDNAAWVAKDEAAEGAIQANILRDIYGNPLRPALFSPSWQTDTAISLSRTMYESRDFSAMPILADALQEAGCDNADILNHCRDATQVHVRGCWVVDLVLGKT